MVEMSLLATLLQSLKQNMLLPVHHLRPLALGPLPFLAETHQSHRIPARETIHTIPRINMPRYYHYYLSYELFLLLAWLSFS